MASLDLTTLQIMRDREQYNKYHRMIPEGLMDVATTLILQDYSRYFKEYDHDAINYDAFKSAFFGKYHPKLSDEQRAHYRIILGQCLSNKVDAIVRKNFINNMIEQDYATQVAELLGKYNNGDDIDIMRRLSAILDEAESDLDRKRENKFIDDDISDLLAVDEHQTGITWRLNGLASHMRPLIAGDFGIIAGRPDSGKTTLLVSELTHMAPQITEAFGEPRPILWVNNEGPGRRIKPRLYQAALDKTVPELIELNRAGGLVDAYLKCVGDANAIRILDVHGWWNYEVEDVIKEIKPAIVVYDMIDNIKFAGGNAGARTDQVLEGMYQWAREICVKHDAIGICTSQVSAEGEGLLFPGMSMLKDSKTGKQGACDFQIMIGRNTDFNAESLRGIGIVKNKLRVDGMPGDPRAEVLFDGNRARYRDAT